MLNVTIVVGNPKPKSRTLHIAETLVRKLLVPETYTVRVIDLADHSSEIFEWPSEVMSELNGSVADSNLAIFASPTYKATYTGLLKGFLDRYAAGGLRGVTAIPVMTGADLTHSMAPDVNLRPLLIELGASSPTKGLYFVTSQMEQMDQIVSEWAEENAAVFRLFQPLLEAIAARYPDSDTSAKSLLGGAGS